MDITKWLNLFVRRMQDTFQERLCFVGIQGSYGRGEASEKSDLDVVVIIQGLGFDDLKAYRTAIRGLPEWEKICGFVAGESELQAWERGDLIQLVSDTVPVFGTWKRLVGDFSDRDKERAILIGACNLYHGCCHNYVHERSEENLRMLYKLAGFVIRMRQFWKSGVYTPQMKKLLETADEEDQKILQWYFRLRESSGITEEEFECSSAKLLSWSSQMIQLFGRGLGHWNFN